MEKSKIHHPKIMSFSYLTNNNMNKYYIKMIDFENYPEWRKKFLGPIKYYKGNNTHDYGNKFKFLWLNQLNITMKIIEHSIEPLERFVNFRSTTTPISIPYDSSFLFLKDTLTKKVLLIWKFVYETPETIPFSKESFETSKKDTDKHINTLDKLIEKDTVFMNFQVESVLINTDINTLWNEVSNMKNLSKYKENNVKEAIYEGDVYEIGTIVTLIVEESKVTRFRILYIDKDLTRNEMKIGMEYVEGKPELPKQTFEFLLNGLSGSLTFLKFTHYFKEKLDRMLMKFISVKKRKLLKAIRQNFFINI